MLLQKSATIEQERAKPFNSLFEMRGKKVRVVFLTDYFAFFQFSI